MPIQLPPRLRDTALPGADGKYSDRILEAIFNRELYPVINKLRDAIGDIIDNISPTRITPPIITADQNNYTTEGLAGAGYVRIAGDADRTITGMSAADFAEFPFWEKTFVNIGAFKFFFPSLDPGSDAANQFQTPSDLEIALLPNDSVTFWYDGDSLKLRMV